MKDHTSFRVGGPVDYLITPEFFDEVVAVIKLCSKYSMPYFLIGKGSNLLVKDGGIRGVVIKLTKLSKIIVNDEYLTAFAGAELKDVCSEALNSSLTGLEFACGIPGSVGGALTMNAGAYHGEMSHVVESALIVDRHGNYMELNRDQLELGYRMSSILKHGYSVLEVRFKLQKGEYQKIKDRIDDLTKRRSEKQPLEYASAGSTFKRPEGHFAAKLIEDSGLKGAAVGDAIVSPKHSGFIINKGNARAEDVLKLIEIVQDRVRQQYNVELHTEVRILGE
jgi:UDP-N-acetylmuramate dehydrogenase